jgi:capsular exopolysaccharide synthesis family protein
MQVPETAREEREPSLIDYLSVVRSYWTGVVLLVAMATAAAFGWYLMQPRIYEAESSGIVLTGSSENLSLSVAGDSLAKSKAKSYKSVGESVLVAERVISALGLSESPQTVSGTVTVNIPVESAQIQVKAVSAEPARAQAVADAWVAALAEQVHEIEKANATPGSEPVSKIVPLAKASVPAAPVSPKLGLALGLGAAGGLLLGLMYAVVRSRIDRRVRSASEIERRFHLPVVGTLPRDKLLAEAGRDRVDASRVDPTHATGEALRELRTNLSFIDVDSPPRILLVTSSVPSEGKSTVISNLAVTMGASGEDVIIVDADLRRPTLHKIFDIVGEAGVTDVLTGRADIDDVLQDWGPMPNLKIMASGHIPPNPSELLGSKAMQHLLDELSERAVVLIDTPPLLPVTDAAVLSRAAHGTLVVARAGSTTTDKLQRALGNIARVDGRVLGVILNCVATTGPDKYSYGYYGTYTSASPSEERSVDAKTPISEVAKVQGQADPPTPSRRSAAKAVQAFSVIEPLPATEAPEANRGVSPLRTASAESNNTDGWTSPRVQGRAARRRSNG